MNHHHHVRCAHCKSGILVSPLHPKFPLGPFVCPDCTGHHPHVEADAAIEAEVEEASADGVVVDVKMRF